MTKPLPALSAPLLAGLGLLLLTGACGRGEPEAGAPAATSTSAEEARPGQPTQDVNPTSGVVGSRSCRECHERFYELWAPSHHGTAMQPFTPDLARERLAPLESPLEIQGAVYDFEVTDAGGFVVEGPVAGAPGEKRRYPVLHVMGGKNVFFLLTPFERGRLQVLPIAFDVREGTWYDTTASMVRHAVGHADEPVAWTDSLLTFNTSCWSCHVSQLSINYDVTTDTYRSEWAEPGINCETCHGPAEEHVRLFREAPPGEVPASLGLTSMKALDTAQRNDACSPCHAKAMIVSEGFEAGESYFDYFDLACLEDRDFYPDGRDLGENYTLTLWRMSPCARSGELDCIHCHTSSGRFRFVGERANEACMPCHEDHVTEAAAHTHHEADSPGSRCIACHMPMTTFARMQRSDHSMRPPAPSLTMAHGSPNACNLCHDDRDAAWADEHVRAWRERDYQALMLDQAALVAAARAGDTSRLDEMLAVVRDPAQEVLATSLIRLLAGVDDRRVVAACLEALENPSPLVRASAADVLEPYAGLPPVAAGLLGATADERRLVRVRAAASLAAMPAGDLPDSLLAPLKQATEELEASLRARPDQWHTHFNLGNLLERRGATDEAAREYEMALRLRPDAVPPRVNLAMLHARAGQLGRAENELRRALEHEPANPQASYNLGLLLAEKGERKEAARRLETALEADPTLGRAALNLAVLYGEMGDLGRAVERGAQAASLSPRDPRTVSTYAYYLAESGDSRAAIAVLEKGLAAGACSPEVYALLGEIHQKRDDPGSALRVWERARDDERLPRSARQSFAEQVASAQR